MSEIKFYEDPQDYGTENYWRHLLVSGFVYTDGVKHMAEKFGAYWLIDAVASYVPGIRKISKDETFYVVTCILNKTGGCLLSIKTDTREPDIARQDIESTSLTENVKMYLAFEGPRTILLMPTEY